MARRMAAGPKFQLSRIVRQGNGMKINDGEERFEVSLACDRVPQCANVVAQMYVALRLDTRKNSQHRFSGVLGIKLINGNLKAGSPAASKLHCNLLRSAFRR
jgi:hypothetical protein